MPEKRRCAPKGFPLRTRDEDGGEAAPLLTAARQLLQAVEHVEIGVRRISGRTRPRDFARKKLAVSKAARQVKVQH
jgi:hypothetical protein